MSNARSLVLPMKTYFFQNVYDVNTEAGTLGEDEVSRRFNLSQWLQCIFVRSHKASPEQQRARAMELLAVPYWTFPVHHRLGGHYLPTM